MRIQYLVDKELDLVSGGEDEAPVPMDVKLDLANGILVLPITDASTGGQNILEHVEFAFTGPVNRG